MIGNCFTSSVIMITSLKKILFFGLLGLTLAKCSELGQKNSFFHLDDEDWSQTLETELENAQWRREHKKPIKSKREAPVAEAVKDGHDDDDVDGDDLLCSVKPQNPNIPAVPHASRVVGLSPKRKKKLIIPPKFARA